LRQIRLEDTTTFSWERIQTPKCKHFFN